MSNIIIGMKNFVNRVTVEAPIRKVPSTTNNPTTTITNRNFSLNILKRAGQACGLWMFDGIIVSIQEYIYKTLVPAAVSSSWMSEKITLSTSYYFFCGVEKDWIE